MRLDKFLSHSTGISRSEIKKAIKRSAVSINGEVVRSPDIKISESDVVCFDSEQITAAKPIYLLLNKPTGYICATTDSQHPTVIDLLPDQYKQCKIAGRLDIDSTGLVLLSDDGSWIHKVASPNAHCKKHYRVSTELPITQDAVALFSKGILLHNETKCTRPAELIVEQQKQAVVVLSEGKYHQIKRMFAATGNRVTSLHRLQVGAVTLTNDVTPGAYRLLTDDEIQSFN